MADSEMVFEVTDLNFGEEIEGTSGLAIVDFWAAWCGPCRMVAPIVAELAKEYSEQGLRVGKLDVDQNTQTASKGYFKDFPFLTSILIFWPPTVFSSSIIWKSIFSSVIPSCWILIIFPQLYT